MKPFVSKTRPYMEGIAYSVFVDEFADEIRECRKNGECFYKASKRLYKKYKNWKPLKDHRPPFAVFLKTQRDAIMKQRQDKEHFYKTASRMWKYEKDNATPLYMRMKQQSNFHPAVAQRYYAMLAKMEE